MALLAVFIGAILFVTAIQDTYRALSADLKRDIPGFLVWAAALIGVGVLQYIPKFAPIGRALLGLVLFTLILKNYKNIIAGFQAITKELPNTATQDPTPAQAYRAETVNQTEAPTKPVEPATTGPYDVPAATGNLVPGGALTRIPSLNPQLPDISGLLPDLGH